MLLGADNFAEAWLIMQPGEGAEDTNLVLKVRPSKVCFIKVALLVQNLKVLLHLHDLLLLHLDMICEVAVTHNLCSDCPVSDFLDFLTDNLKVGGGATKELKEPTGEWEDRVCGVIVGLCIQVSDVEDHLRAIVLKESGAMPIWELLDPVGSLP